MRFLSTVLAAAVLVLGTSARSPAYQRPTAEPGGLHAGTLSVQNPSDESRTVSARARLRGSRFWGSDADRAARGAWVEVPPLSLAPGEMVQVPVELPVPEIPFRPLEVEIRDLGRAEWSPGEDLFRPLMAEPSDPPPVEAPEGRRLPYRVIAGGDAPMDAGFFGDPEPLLTATAVARDEASWDAVRESLKILSPDSWGTFPVEADDPGPQYRAVRFSTVRPPDLSTDTILAIRTGRLGPGGIHLRFCVRSVSIRPNGSILCTYSYRRRYLPGPHYQIDTPGHWLLIAIPKTDAPIVFRRVP